jgi:hypothetical protein
LKRQTPWIRAVAFSFFDGPIPEPGITTSPNGSIDLNPIRQSHDRVYVAALPDVVIRTVIVPGIPSV